MKFTTLILFLLVFSCVSEKEKDIPSISFQRSPSTQIYFSKSDHKVNSDYFEKDSSFTKFLIFSFKNNFIQVKEIEISLTSYSNEFLKSINSAFPGKIPKKYKISKIIKTGSGEERKNPAGIQVDYKTFSILESEGNTLTEIIRDIASLKENTINSQETIFYLRSKDQTLWKGLEFISRGKNDLMVWKNSQGGSTTDYAYTEFSPKKNVVEYSKIFSYSNYKYKPITIPDQKENIYGCTLYSDLHYLYFYSPQTENETTLTKDKGENLLFIDCDENLILTESYKSISPYFILKKGNKKNE